MADLLIAGVISFVLSGIAFCQLSFSIEDRGDGDEVAHFRKKSFFEVV